MRILIFGGTGMLGHKLYQVLGSQHRVHTTIRGAFTGVEAFGIFDRDHVIENIDAEDLSGVRRAIDTVRPDIVINAVGIIKQLSSDQNIVQTLQINAIFPHRLAELSLDFGFKLITISTDCVFDGKKGNYTESDVSDAIDLYGRSKSLGEVKDGKALTIRTSIIGRELAGSHSIVEWFLGHRGRSVKGFTKAIYTGFPAELFCSIVSDIIDVHAELSGVYHISSDPISKYELLRLLNAHFQADVEIVPSDDVIVDRSLNSARFRQATDFVPESWDEMIRKMADDLTDYDRFRSR